MEKKIVLQHPENGECATVKQGGKEFHTRVGRGGVEVAAPAVQASSGRGSKQQASRHTIVQEEDPERMKHSKTRAVLSQYNGQWSYNTGLVL